MNTTGCGDAWFSRFVSGDTLLAFYMCRRVGAAHAAEHSADVEKNRALVVLAEADVPKAMAEALKNGNLGAMDWYRMQNIDSDTRMRSSIAGDAPGGSESGQES